MEETEIGTVGVDKVNEDAHEKLKKRNIALRGCNGRNCGATITAAGIATKFGKLVF